MSAGAGIRVLRECDRAALKAMPTFLSGRLSHGSVAVSVPPSKKQPAAEIVRRAKLMSAPQWGKGPDGEPVQVLFRYPDGECAYRRGNLVIVGRVEEQ